MVYTTQGAESINDLVQRLKQLKMSNGILDANGQPVKPDWQNFTPQTLSWQKPSDTGVNSAINDEIANRDTQVTNTAIQEAQNRTNQSLYQQQLALLRTAKKSQINRLSSDQVLASAAQNPIGGKLPHQPAQTVPSSNGVTVSQGTPKPGKLTTITSHGHTVTVNSAVAGRFKGFLDALWSQGYHFKSVGGYANRNIASGPSAGSARSAHSYGYAIDIDPTKNPTSPIHKSNQYVYALPPSVGALAAKYGLHWGGNWHSYKDFMHFSVPINGVE